MAEIIPIEFGKSVLPESMIFSGGKKNKYRPIVFMIYLVKTEDKLILVDAGCETMPGFVTEDFIGPVEALKKLNITPSDITDVIITHAHYDHIECVNRFKNAAVYIQSDEYEAGKDFFDKSANVRIFDESAEICKNVKAVKIGGHTSGSCIVEIIENTHTYIIAGDECYLRECLNKKIPTGSSFCPKKSREFISKYSGKNYIVYLSHEKFDAPRPCDGLD